MAVLSLVYFYMVICMVGHNGMTADCKSAASGTVGSIPTPYTKFSRLLENIRLEYWFIEGSKL